MAKARVSALLLVLTKEGKGKVWLKETLSKEIFLSGNTLIVVAEK